MRYVRGRERPVSRAQLTEHLGVSRSKVSLVVGQLVRAGLLVEDGLGESDGGRRSSLLRIPGEAGLVAAVDLGASSVDLAVTTLSGEVLGRIGEPADIRDGPNRILGRVAELLAGILDEQGSPRARSSRLESGCRVRWNTSRGGQRHPPHAGLGLVPGP